MCFHSQQNKSPQEIAKRFNIEEDDIPQNVTGIYNGFEFPKTPVITSQEPKQVQLYSWGLIPHWANDKSIRKNTLNAKIETLSQRPSFKDVVNNRCLILSDGFYEWQWRDSKGKNKQKYLITVPNENLFSFAGIWSEWTDPETGISQKSYSIITTEANSVMAEIHNTKQRMPVILPKSLEQDWLQQKPIDHFSHLNIDLIPTRIGGHLSLFD